MDKPDLVGFEPKALRDGVLGRVLPIAGLRPFGEFGRLQELPDRRDLRSVHS